MNSARNKQLKTQAHLLNPVITVGQQGLTESVLKELDITLKNHELIKIKIRAERELRKQISVNIIEATQAELIQSIGQIIVIYKINPDK
ncbi:MAG: YhbY family RNA-binding protein [Methylococcales bacterium]|nr:YhbY family RNA-binding protein [Methylococcales bacterium]